jgi:hypothetical protein
MGAIRVDTVIPSAGYDSSIIIASVYLLAASLNLCQEAFGALPYRPHKAYSPL